MVEGGDLLEGDLSEGDLLEGKYRIGLGDLLEGLTEVYGTRAFI
jgi:hypothetical protein